MNATAPYPAVVTRVVDLPLDMIRESAWNPRQHWNAAADEDLVRSIREVGLLTPVLVRPVDKSGLPCADADNAKFIAGYELAAGHRRLRAAKVAGLETVPATIRVMDDAAFREVLVIENLQRADIHPLDEAAAYEQILKADKAYTVDALAARVGKHKSYVYKRLKLAGLIPAARDAYFAEEITAGHADRLARLTAKQQEQGLKHCFLRLFDDGPAKREAAPLSELDRWIQDAVILELKVTEDLTHYQPDFAAALGQEPEADKLLQLSGAYYSGKVKAVTRDKWREIESTKDRCEHVQRGVIVHGGAPRIVDVCVKADCKKHRPPHPSYSSPGGQRASSKPTPAELKQREKEKREREQREAWRKVESKATAAFEAHIRREAPAVTPALVEAVIGDHELKHTLKRLGTKKVTAENMGAALAIFALDTGADTYDPIVFTKFAKPFGFDVAAFVRDNTPKPKPVPAAKKVPAKKAAKKR